MGEKLASFETAEHRKIRLVLAFPEGYAGKFGRAGGRSLRARVPPEKTFAYITFN